ncbi:DNA polymerase III subunit beta, partial [Candidatus Uhrbacteria bacterium]|nr:DNA polymerase III subunit beta [Candidatus Uhrbacteria bacterium]
KLIIVGTDAYRLAKRTLSVKSDISEDISLIIPQKTLHELERILQMDTEKELEMYINENQVLFLYEGVELLSKLITQNYPDYEQIIPTSFGTESVIETKEFLKAIKLSSIFSRSGLNDIHCSFRAETSPKGEVCISASNASIGENIAKLPIECKGADCDVILNYRYTLEGLQSFEDDRLFFGAGDAQSPCVVRPLQNKDILYLIMPIRE